MKVVLVSAGTLRRNTAGVEQSVYYLAKYLQKKGIDVEVYGVTDHAAGSMIYDGIPITEFPGFIFHKSFYFSRKLYQALKKGDHDVIHAVGTNSLTTLNALWAKKKGQRLFITGASSVSSSPLRKNLHPLLYAMYRHSAYKIDGLICVSDYEYNLFKENIRLPESKYLHIPNGIDVGKFSKTKKKKIPHSILTVARLVKQKGVHRLIGALPLLLKKYPDATLHVVGDGIERKNLEELSNNLGVSKNVVFHGYIQFEDLDKLAGLYAQSHVFSLMADSESQGLVYAMGVASRIPVVTTDSSAMVDLIKQKVAVGVKNPDDMNELAKVLAYAFEHDPPKVDLEKVLWSWDRIGEAVLKAYKEKR